MKYYRFISLILAIVFGSVGLIFLFISDGVIEFFNSIAALAGMKLSPTSGVNFYLILAIGYMYLVSLIAFMMYKYPDNRYFPLLLSNAKIASSILSLYFFIWHQPYLIYITNCLIDGSIGGVALYFYIQIKNNQT